jgi:DNA-binding LytR/AlgR family response regulator
MRVMILEFEPPAMQQLVLAVESYDRDIEVIAQLGSVREAVKALAGGLSPDLILANIHLSDTTSLELFDRVEVSCPVVFVTAHDAYLLRAFERGTIDYVLEPIEPARLAAALDKHLRLRSQGKAARPRERILARRGMELLAVPVERVAWFMSEHRLTIVCEKGGARHLVDETLGELEKALDPRRFFRLNRRFRSVGKGRLGVALEPRPDDDVVVSQERAAVFRDWVEGR